MIRAGSMACEKSDFCGVFTFQPRRHRDDGSGTSIEVDYAQLKYVTVIETTLNSKIHETSDMNLSDSKGKNFYYRSVRVGSNEGFLRSR
ncbi:hypothetical protein L1987_10606 [Smallanthus sonchifolius]|uniref:Uncharacterized protein n=1 Tax=Smallanthus sonchifolius TaxID=185202 RepID=A0ACB9JSJ1_9ASTR|nr:hypothetical protein L1987_10606 [Smallanthus sonchifolius]